jgi:hypothetical protein
VLLPYLAAVTVLYSCAELIHAPTSNALAAEAAPAAQRGSYLAAFQYGFTMATLAVPGAFGVLFAVDPELPWVVVGALAAAGAVAMRHLRTRLPAHAVT